MLYFLGYGHDKKIRWHLIKISISFRPSSYCITVVFATVTPVIAWLWSSRRWARSVDSGNYPLQQGSLRQHGAHLGPTVPRWGPCWPHELCYPRRHQISESGGLYNYGWQHVREKLCTVTITCDVWDEIAYHCLNFNDATLEVFEMISNFTPHFIMDEIVCPCWDKS